MQISKLTNEDFRILKEVVLILLRLRQAGRVGSTVDLVRRD